MGAIPSEPNLIQQNIMYNDKYSKINHNSITTNPTDESLSAIFCTTLYIVLSLFLSPHNETEGSKERKNSTKGGSLGFISKPN